MTYQYAILAIFVTFALLEAKHGKFFKKDTEVTSDGYVELIGTLMLFIVTQPFVLFSSAFLMSQAFPDYAGVLANSSFLIHIALLLIFDDMMQYWWHRASHNNRFLYFLHRAPS